MKTSPQHPPWEDLLPPLLELIMERLPVPDYLRFAAVCTCWRDVQRQHLHRAATSSPRCQMPWLIEITKFMPSAYSPSEKRPYFLSLPPRVESMSCRGTSRGCLLFYNAKAAEAPNNSLLLLNPLAAPGSEIEIPIPSSLWCDPWVFLSSDHTDPDCIVLLCDWDNWYFCRISDNQQTVSKSLLPWKTTPGSIAISAGKFYILSGPSGKNSEGKTLLIVDPFPIWSATYLDMDWDLEVPDLNYEYLLKSDGQILLAKLIWEYGPDDGECIFLPKIFKKIQVFRADLSRKLWVRLESLGDHVLFLCFGHSFSMSAAETGGPPNHIYITERRNFHDWKQDKQERLWIEYDYGSHQLMTSKIPHGIFCDDFVSWIVPSLY